MAVPTTVTIGSKMMIPENNVERGNISHKVTGGSMAFHGLMHWRQGAPSFIEIFCH